MIRIFPRLLKVSLWCCLAWQPVEQVTAQNRFATSDNQSGYVHWIDLYDANNTRIDPNQENPPPYDPGKTCGRCHDVEQIAHGWHFNALDSKVPAGRPGFPWVWRDPRTGTFLPLSYRDWAKSWNPDRLGMTRWEVAAHFGGYLPGAGVGSGPSLATSSMASTEQREVADDADQETEEQQFATDRTAITGPLPLDCMICHHRPGSGYSPFAWTEQIESQNFAYAPTAAAGIGTVTGNTSRLRDDFDPAADGAADRLPKVAYDLNRFRTDGKVFFDLVRKPSNDACYYCHTNMPAAAVGGQRWLHDEDVHLRAGMQCADCHRNGLDHHTVRGFAGERHAHGFSMAAFSCQGCHLGEVDGRRLEASNVGRLGAPRPLHRGLPPLHFEKLSCTACHSGPVTEQELDRQVNSMIHRLGEHVKRDGDELPGIVGGALLPLTSSSDSPLYPHRLLWPSYWAVMEKGTIQPLHPERAYELVRRALRVRRDFSEELAEVRLPLSQRREILGDSRAGVREEDWTDEERQQIRAAEAQLRKSQISERMVAALSAIEEAYPGQQAVYISGGQGFVRDGDTGLKKLDREQLGDAADPYKWPLAHNVRPARQALGADGCTDCHRADAPLFNMEVRPIAVLPDQQPAAVPIHRLQGIDRQLAERWNRLFGGRELFKVVGWGMFLATCGIFFAAVVWNLGSYWNRRAS
ncbi:MAG: hypothetical protein KatS3mg111_0984 [Pirellulaceae bacterium]|nr:MAG: hypothetical protein KatS3mg111_0984 [Pirellulaceae bacterium]